MKWYDYIFCFAAADVITASILTGNIFGLTIGIVGYIVYEKLSMWERNQ